ncbi:MAG: acetaldehyde dehydrogenase (acetylating) [Oscillospiraceae bacterium]|jgi:acetaldehyde dehydrogenase (acetylating)|nr:acetaldehyde dehydrogenase (acetylating) [Oscillospiraceae bacterium]
MQLDRDLESIQAVRNLIKQAKAAAEQLAGFSQTQLNSICAEIALDGAAQAERLAKLAADETGFGIWQDKVRKNLLGSRDVWARWKDETMVGPLTEYSGAPGGYWEIGVPMGIIAALIPSTNPTSTTLYKAIIALKAGNAVIFSPHPNAKGCIWETVRLIQAAAARAGAPEHAIQCVELCTMEATNALMSDPAIGLILATGGEAMVRAAYRSGNPAIGVGPGNGPAFIERSADIPTAVRHIIASKTFDNGVICASEQSIITEECVAAEVEAELKRQGGYFLPEEESERLGNLLLRPNGTMNPRIVGKPAHAIAEMAGIAVPEGTKLLLSRQTAAGPRNPYAREKLCPVLAYFVEPDWERACARCMEILHLEGAGHTMAIHSRDDAVIREFALQKPVSRLLVNTPAALGGVGATTALDPALTLGCGSVGGSATSDNVGPRHLVNIRRVAWYNQEAGKGRQETGNLTAIDDILTPEQVAEIARRVLERLAKA